MNDHTMRFGTDIFGLVEETEEPDTPSEETPTTTPTAAFKKKALLISKKPLDCTNKSAVLNFIISGEQPTGTLRRCMFKIDDKVYKFSSGNLVEYTGEITADNVLSNGNSVDGLNALSNITGFVGKKIYPIIALQAKSTADDMPTIKIQLNTRTDTASLTYTDTSEEFPLTSGDAVPRISSMVANTSITGGGSVTIKARLKNENGTWTDYMTLAETADLDATAVQFKITYKVTTADGSDSAKVNFITVEHTLGKAVISGTNANLYSIVADYDVPLQLCYVVIRHNPLEDSSLKAYVNFMKKPARRERLQIGIANGSRQTLTLGEPDLNIDFSSLEIYADDVQLTDFDANSIDSSVTLKATSGAAITATYDYNHGEEEWREMTLDFTEPYKDGETVMSRFVYSLPDEDAADKTVSNIKIEMKRASGTESDYYLGKATGKKQLFVLPHFKPKAATITFDNAAVDFIYDDESNVLTLTAPKKTALNVSYKWLGENISIVSWSAGWSVA